MLSVGAIRFEDRFCTSENGGIEGSGCRFRHSVPGMWWLSSLAIERPWSKLARPFLSFIVQTGVETTPLPLWELPSWHSRQF